MSFEVRNRADDWSSELLTNYASMLEDDDLINSLTFQEEQHDPLPQAINIDGWVPSQGQIFNSDDDAYEFYCSFAQRSGFSIRRHHVYRSKNQDEGNLSGVYKREFVCHRSGVPKPTKVNEVESQRNRKTSRCNCSAKLLVTRAKN
ncbi:hypothetical protein TSUD_375260 [Trifolium subterraneum]|uniref:FAR1 domain-containing protein n=1 Tax=Trifolium subterraneum TaxID=3900 RepID=A0A2Z6MTJ1_TRISU|nr:hypothetical protein TSUD_375260 [Trifolium subterraneum]